METTRGGKECFHWESVLKDPEKIYTKGEKNLPTPPPRFFFYIEIPTGLHSLNKSTARSDSSLLLGFVCLLLINRADVIFLSVGLFPHSSPALTQPPSLNTSWVH